MLKLIPLILIPFCFFIIFLGVKNLTDNFQLSVENKTEEISKAKVEKIENQTEEISTAKVEKEVIKETDYVEKVEKNTEFPQDNSEKENLIVKPVNPLNEGLKKNIEEKKKNSADLTKTELKKKNTPKEFEESEKKLSLQFGAFSKESNAISSKESIEKKVKSKFSGFEIRTYFDKKTKLYKLLYATLDENLAKNICNFCKKNKISCLIKKQ